MKKICKAINEGVKSNLIDFGNDKILKHNNINNKLYDFGDIVYYDRTLGYNPESGKEVAVCVTYRNQKPLYIAHTNYGIWAERETNLYCDTIPSFDNGWDATQYILKNYKDDIDNCRSQRMIWRVLEENEYIPTANELKIMYNNVINSDNEELKKVLNTVYWSSSLVLLDKNITTLGIYAYSVDLGPLSNKYNNLELVPNKIENPIVDIDKKSEQYNSLILLKLHL